MTADPVAGEIAALRRELTLTRNAHEREHKQHEEAHGREHAFAQAAIDKAADMAKENKADANEWRGTMTDRERSFATKADVVAILDRLTGLERANIVAGERESARAAADAEERRQAERRASRSQWIVGLVVGLAATIGAILINLVIRAATPS